MKKKRAKKSFDKFFEKYTWAKDETPAEGDEQRKALTVQLDKLYKARSQLKPSDPRRAEAERLPADTAVSVTVCSDFFRGAIRFL